MLAGFVSCVCMLQTPVPSLTPACLAVGNVRSGFMAPQLLSLRRPYSSCRNAGVNVFAQPRKNEGSNDNDEEVNTPNASPSDSPLGFDNAKHAANVMRLLGGSPLFPQMEDPLKLDSEFPASWTNFTGPNKKIEGVRVGQIQPKMSMIFTCSVCETRQMRTFSKHAYEKGIVIVTCKGCQRRHLIADNLGWHSDWREQGYNNVEDMFADRGLPAPKRIAGKDAQSIFQEWHDIPTNL